MNGSPCVFKFNIEQPSIVLNPCLYLQQSLHAQSSPSMSWFVWSIYLAIWKTPSPFADTVANSSFSAWGSVSQTVCFATNLASMKAILASLASSAMPPFFRARQTLNRACFFSIALSTSSFNHQNFGFHWWFLERPQISVAASSKGPLSFDQADSTHLQFQHLHQKWWQQQL